MVDEALFRLAEMETAHAKAKQLHIAVSNMLEPLLPQTAEIRHIGATAVPGCLTKGDLDIVVRVCEKDFKAADTVLAERFARNEGSVRTSSFSAFEESTCQPHLGIQLTVIDGPYDFFHLFVEALNQSPEVVEQYNQLKRIHNGSDMLQYRIAKNVFIESVLAKVGSSK